MSERCCLVCRTTEGPLHFPPGATNGFHQDCYEALREAVREADIILGVDPKTGKQKEIIYGEALLQLIAAHIERDDLPLEVLRVPIDCDDDLNQVRSICVLEGKEVEFV